MIKPGLRSEIIVTLTIVMMAASFLISMVVITITKKNIIDRKIETTAALINFLQHSIDSICSADDEAFQRGEHHWQLQRLVTLFALEKEVATVFIVDSQGRVIAATDSSRIGALARDEDLNQAMKTFEIITRLPSEKPAMFPKANGLLTISAPLYIKHRLVGAVRMTSSLQPIQSAIDRSYKVIVTYILFTSVMIILFGSVLFSRVLVRPIRKLVNATESIGRGEFHQLTNEKNRNEIGQLTFAFNRMTQRIKQHQQELQSKIESLEVLNRKLQQTQNEVLAGEKLALVGKLSAGIAHEIGNPLSAVLGYISLLQKDRNLTTESADYLARVEQELNRINKTIRELLDFSRLKKDEATTVNVKPVIEHSLALVAHQKQFSGVTLRVYVEDDLWPVRGDEQHLQQVFLNLLLNAGDALENEGAIVVLADRMVVHEGTLISFASFSRDEMFALAPDFALGRPAIDLDESIRVSEGEPMVRILVADNGKGIEPENLNRIFDPFFTTKGPGKGTGLGLAVCTRIIESSGGRIMVRSRVNQGSAFLLLIPAKGINHE